MGASSYGDDATIGGGDITVAAADGDGSTLVLSADNSDDAGDDWQLAATTSQTLTIGSDKAMAGTFVPQLTLTPHATPTSSTTAVTGDFTTGGDLTVGDDLLLDEYVYHNGDSDTFIRFQDDDITFDVGGINFLKMTEDDTQDKIMINNNGTDLDFIVKSPNESKALYLNSGNEVFHINHGESNFTTKIHNTNDVVVWVDSTGVVFNENSHDDVDFRIETASEDEAFFVDGSADTIYINKGATSVTTIIKSNNEEAIRVGAAGVTINEYGHASNDFRVESDNDTHMLFVDAGTDKVGIGTSTPYTTLSVVHDYNGTTFENQLSDGQGGGEILKYSPGADDTLTVGQLYYLHVDGTWDQTDADAVATGASQLLGIGLGSARTVGVLLKGFVRIPSTEILNLPGGGACDGLPVYVSTTAGHLDFTAPSGNNDFVRVVGYAIDDDSSDVLVYFNPDPTWVVVSA